MPQALIGFLTPLVGATLAPVLANAVIGLGFTLLSNLIKPKGPKPENGQGLIRQSVSPRHVILGDGVRWAGSILFIEVKNGTLDMIVYHCQGPIARYGDTIFMEGKEIDVDYTGVLLTAPYDQGRQSIQSRIGTFDQTAFSDLITKYPTIYASTARCRLSAVTYLKAESVQPEYWSKVYPNRIPSINRIIYGCPCYDPRITAHDPDDSDTWDETGNLALQLLWYIRNDDGMGMADEWIDLGSFARAATDCDDVLENKAGEDVRRYWGAIVYSLEAEPKDVVSRFINATAGRLYLNQYGQIAFEVGKTVDASFVIDDDLDHIIDCDLTNGAGPFTEANEVIVKFTHVEAGYKEATSDPWRDEDSIEAIGVRNLTVDAYEIKNHNHARRIAKYLALKSNPRWTGTIRCTLHAMQGWDKRYFTLRYPDLDIDMAFEITGPITRDDDMTLTIPCQSFPTDGFDFDAATEEGEGPIVPEAIEEEDIPDPTGVTTGYDDRLIGTVTDTVYDPDDGTNTPTEQVIRVKVGTIQWDAAPREGLIGEAQYSLNGGVDWIGMAVATGGRKAETGPLELGQTVKLRARWRSIGGGASDWVNGTDVTIPG